MSTIKKLDQATILKLAAGEIIDRPVSIVKELVENSIDAKATKIIVSLSGGGISEISVEDNGCGIPATDIENAIEPHATSKLAEFDDIDRVLTMGFRGEALASIAAVADIKIHSFNGSDELGVLLTCPAGGTSITTMKARNQGTTITVSHLFKKVPVRFRFLKSASAEANMVTRLIQQFCLHYPHISFTLMHNNQTLISTNGVQHVSEQFHRVLSLSEGDSVSFNKQTQDVTVSGVMTTPNKTYKQRLKCWFSVNGRMVKSPLFFKAMDAALIDVIPRGVYPAIVCLIDCPTTDVDINIHPKKEDVKFTNPDDIFVAIKRAIGAAVITQSQSWRDALNSTRFTNSESLVNTQQNPSMNAVHAINDTPNRSVSTPIINHSATELVLNNSRSEMTESQADSLNRSERAIGMIQSKKIDERSPTVLRGDSQPSLLNQADMLKKCHQWVSLNKKYIVVPMGETLFIFDQHAVHERVLYDRFKAEYEQSIIISMPLLIPEYVPLTPVNRTPLMALLPSLKSLGIDIEVFDQDQLIIREIPQLFSGASLSLWLTDWLDADDISALVESSLDDVVKKLQMKACKAAVKSGQKLHDAEIESLINAAINSKQQYTCPHGRPLYIKMSESHLDGLFLRS
ncbi:MAG: DNA mismatch repair endonuclease MutL [Candidatus Margulisiibacteriota bacterium]